MVIVILVFLGLCFGSFVNALTWRLHEQVRFRHKKLPNKDDKNLNRKLSILKGRSICPSCEHILGSKDLVPILSWLSLKGKCRYCQETISFQYPAVEAFVAILFVASYIWWPASLTGIRVVIFILWLLLIIGLVALVVYDIKWLILPNRIVYPLTYIAILIAVVRIIGSLDPLRTLIDLLLAVLIAGGLFYVLFQLSQGKWIGGGDVRLGFMLGFVMGTPGNSLLLLFIASLAGSIVGVPLLLTKKLAKNSVIPFGPFLILAAVIVQLFGTDILNWYQTTFFTY
ncbi:MAG TPA: prepilin peptidase [Candidatus Saccharimonadales bacterium]|nr:prepilin peptidase [Candidatus Saccharimonadales bacterium]